MRKSVLALASAGLLLCAIDAQADIVTLTGTTFDVVYDTTKLDLFGTPSLSGNDLFFTPNAFDAQSLNGQGSVSTSSLASGIQLVAHDGYAFGNLSIAALGDYQMSGNGSSVNVTGSLSATNSAQPANATHADLVISGSTPMNLNDGANHDWYGTATVAAGWLSDAKAVDLELQNTLWAVTTSGGTAQQAFIQEKFSGIELMVSPVAVPVPAALWMFASGLVGMGLLRRGKMRRDSDTLAAI